MNNTKRSMKPGGMRRLAFRSLAFGVCLAAGLGLLPAAARAEPPYGTAVYDAAGKPYDSQPAYLPTSFVHGSLKNPEDLFIDARDHLYIADTGNNRILHYDDRFELRNAIDYKQGDAKLNEPNGVFVANDGTVYVADTKNERIAVFDDRGTYLRSVKRPKTALLPDSYQFLPTKVAVDERGFMYIATRNGFQGLLLLDPDGQFEGFFGANRVPFSLTDSLKRMFFTQEQKMKELAKLPGTVSNVTIGPDQFLYTTSVSVTKGQIKKLNFDGKDLLGEKAYGNVRLKKNEQYQFTDIAVDAKGNMTAIEAQFGTIYQYNAIGELMFSFGYKNDGFQKLGLFKFPAAIAVNSKGTLAVLDRNGNLVQLFEPTPFGELFRHAMDLYIQGEYDASIETWQEVLHRNSKVSRAHLGLGKAYYKQGRWKEAMAEFREAGYVQGVSDAYWQLRLIWMQKHFTTVVIWSALLFAVLWLGWRWKSARERRKQDVVAQTVV
ncbi:tetratricopeptide repeat protein [Paenibacillus sp. HJGM_3]|uniref:tetratricopeptide repeat protein n=1 Tax=Paenibacillus sp. HJGM_3 TaxID=3379816 RepID=UPI00385EC445